MQTLTVVWSDSTVGRTEEHLAPTDVAELRRISRQVATEAAAFAASARDVAVGDASTVRTKSSETDVVTTADRDTERLVRDRLAELRPNEPVLGEEEGGARGATRFDGLRWVVDPIDGTVNYLYGYPWFAVSIAAQLDGVSVAGAVVEVASGRIWTAGRGQGAELDGTTLRVSGATRLELSLLATGFAYRVERRRRQALMVGGLLGAVRDIRRAGAGSLDLCAVAAGWVDAYVEHGLSRWDWAAGALIAEEAGAIVRVPAEDDAPQTADDGLGRDITIAASPGIAAELTQTLRALGCAEV